MWGVGVVQRSIGVVIKRSIRIIVRVRTPETRSGLTAESVCVLLTFWQIPIV